MGACSSSQILDTIRTKGFLVSRVQPHTIIMPCHAITHHMRSNLSPISNCLHQLDLFSNL